MDALTIPVADAHLWVVFAAWVGAYFAGRILVGGAK